VALVDSQHQFVREHLLGVTTALERLAAIHDEIGKLSADLSWPLGNSTLPFGQA
jgi:uncharacterized small protein (DUF1192 family)